MKIVSIDPGAVHCGVAVWVRNEAGLWSCPSAVEMTPDDCVDFVREEVSGFNVNDFPAKIPDQVVVEGFWLKGGIDAIRQAGSEMETTEVIGAIRHLCRWAGMPFQKVANGQDAIITRLEAAGYEWTARGHGGHAKDAEAVGVRGLGLKVRQLQVVANKRERNA